VQNEDTNPDVRRGAALMHDFIQKTMDIGTRQLSEALGVDRTRLYRGVSPNYGPPPPYEAVWKTTDASDTTVLQEPAATYRESGLVLSEDAHELLDYISVELDYMIQLIQREVMAWSGGIGKDACEAVERQNRFLMDHLSQWVPAFIAKAEEHAETDFYHGHLMMLRGFLSEESERLSVLTEAMAIGS